MSKNRNHSKNKDSSQLSEGLSSSESEIIVTGGAKPKRRSFNATKKKSLKMPGETSSKLLEDEFNADIKGNMKNCDVSLSNFLKIYKVWILKRRKTLRKLRKLLENVHTNLLSFNNTNLLFKEVNAVSRRIRTTDGSNLDFASLTTVITDAIGAVTSIAEACNVDNYMEEFREIMNDDAEFTKPLYDARSNCFSKYKDVEEIVRRYHSETLGSTLNKISDSLKLEDLWLDLKLSRSGDVTRMLNTFDDFINRISREEVFGGIYKSIENYVDNNPAVLDSCESTGKTLYGIYDTWGQDPKKSSLVAKNISLNANQAIIRKQDTEIRRLRSMVSNEDMSQGKLETRIRDALDGLEVEMKEVQKLCKNSSHLSSDGAEYTQYCKDYSDDDSYYDHDYESPYFSV